jgi:hypothetical protein
VRKVPTKAGERRSCAVEIWPLAPFEDHKKFRVCRKSVRAAGQKRAGASATAKATQCVVYKCRCHLLLHKVFVTNDNLKYDVVSITEIDHCGASEFLRIVHT